MAILSEGATAAPVSIPVLPTLASLLAGHVLRDGEVIILILKPSLWYLVLSSLRFIAATSIALIAIQLSLPHPRAYLELGASIVSLRIVWAMLTWMGRLYVLTDQRILRLAGVFNVDIIDCPLRRVTRARLFATFRERLLRLGSIEIIPEDESRACATWQTVSRPREVHRQIVEAIRRAKQGNGLG